MKLTIDLLQNHPEALIPLVTLWYEQEARIALHPTMTFEEACDRFSMRVNQRFPLTLIALIDGIPVGMGGLQKHDVVRTDLTPWLCGLVVHPDYQKRGISQLLINAIKSRAKGFGCQKLYLLTFTTTLAEWYIRLGWKLISTETCHGHPVTVMQIDCQI